MKKLLIIFILFSVCGCSQDGPNIKQIENMQFFIDNKNNEQVVEIEPGLQYMIIDEGDPKGQSPKLNQTISAHFHGTLTNGEVFWTSIDGDPLTTELSKLIIGCQKTISLMKKGDKWRVFIDPTMAYGEVAKPSTEESSGIPSNSILIFEIELLEII
tara:strand:- start:171 stop:641 length:471 start_codon:yes stop_codon:yes gene_type:complete